MRSIGPLPLVGGSPKTVTVHGLRSPTIDTLFKIAGALDMPPHRLMMEIENAVNGAEIEE